MAASARRGLICLAISIGLAPAATDCLLPSGRVISMLLIGKFQRSTASGTTHRRDSLCQNGKNRIMPVSSQAGIDESTLVAQAREGDTGAFGELVRRYEGKIFRLAQHVTQNREDAEEIGRAS